MDLTAGSNWLQRMGRIQHVASVEGAAFMRNWASAYTAARTPNSPTKDRFDIAPLPRGEAGIAATIGGNGYGVSRHSLHPEQAAMLVRFLCSRDEQLRRSRSVALPSTIAQVYNDAEVMAINLYYSRVLEVFSTGKASRPSQPLARCIQTCRVRILKL